MDQPFEVRDRRGGSWFWLDKALLRNHGQQLGPNGIAVYAVLAMHAGRDEECWPGMSTISQLAGCSRSTVKRSLNRLEKLGLIERERVQTETGRHLRNRYTLLAIPDQAVEEPQPTEPPREEVQVEPTIVSEGHQVGSHRPYLGSHRPYPRVTQTPEQDPWNNPRNKGDDDGHPGVQTLVEIGVIPTVALRLAKRTPLNQIQGWVEYAKTRGGLRDPPAFVVSCLQSRTPAPVKPSDWRERYPTCPGCNYVVPAVDICADCGLCASCCTCDLPLEE